MKHLKKINELYKGTFHRAASKLRGQHPTRAEKIMNWAEEKGKSELSREEVERAYPHPFSFVNNKDVKDKYIDSLLLGKFFITGAELNHSLRPASALIFGTGYSGVLVHMMNDWGQKVSLEISWGPDDFLKITLKTSNGKEIKPFLFDNRSDARHFLRYINEWMIDNEFELETSDISINKLYYTN